MKRIVLILLTMFLLAACREEIIYQVAGRRPIVFSQQVAVESRGESLENMNNTTFGVRGYIYDTKWYSEEPLAVPDSKWLNMQVDCDAQGMCTYDSDPSKPDKQSELWKEKKRYTFFGYYPFSEMSNGTVTLSSASGTEFKGAPILTYRLSDAAVGKPANNWVGDATQMFDLMYGNYVDAEMNLTSSVSFDFHHCLSGIEVVAENFYNDKTKVVEILDFQLQLNLNYREIVVPMNGEAVTKNPFDGGGAQKVTFPMIKKGTDAKKTVENTLGKSPVDITGGNHLLVIPQTGITGNAVVECSDTTINMPLVFHNLELLPGTRYVIDLQFVEKEINVLVIEGTSWTEKKSVIEFE